MIACALVRAPLEIRSDGYARGVTATELGLPALRGAARRDPARPADPRLVDSFGRVATDLRISLTDRCNLRCTYCMPAEGLDWMPRDEQLTDDELVRLITIAVRDLGVHELRFTGGEPLLRRGLERIIAASAALRPRPDISLTTNGIGLARRAEALAAAGVDRLNVRSTRCAPTVSPRSPAATASPTSSRASPPPATRGSTPSRSTPCCCAASTTTRPCRCWSSPSTQGFELRFIEQMPLDAQHGWQRAEMVTAGEIMERSAPRSRSRPTRTSAAAPRPSGGSSTAGPRSVGVIASVTRPFCGACDRTRLTSDGQIRSCLFARTETDLRALLRGGASDAGDRRHVARRHVGQARGPRHRRPRLPAAGPPDERDRGLGE